MTPVWDKEKGLVKFERRIDGQLIPMTIPVEDMVYLWYRNPLHETQPDQPPAAAAMSAAGILYNTNFFANAFLERGAIKATLLTVKGSIAQQERNRLKDWWNRVVGGVKNAGNAEVVAADVVPVIIGEGLSELSNTELTGESREEIATTLGIPLSMVFSNATTYATANQDKANFYDETVFPEAEIIANQLNKELFEPLGFHFDFVPEALEINKKDENQRSQAFRHYVDAGLKQSVAAEIVGIELPEGLEYADLDPEEPEVQPVQPQGQPRVQPAEPDAEQYQDRRAADLEKWRRKAQKRLASGKSALIEFESVWLSPLEIAFVRSRLATAKTKTDVDAAFLPQEEDAKSLRFIPRGADEPRPPVPAQLDITDDDIEHAIQSWDNIFPDYAGLLEADVQGQGQEL
jgi:hypothetical protein